MTKELIMPTSPSDIKKLSDALEECLLCYQKMDDQKLQMKAIFDMIKEELDIEPKFTRKLAKTYYKNSFENDKIDNEEFETLYELILGSSDNN